MTTILDRKFEIVRPSLDRLVVAPVEVNDNALLNPLSTSPLALVDGELVQPTTTGKFIRATDASAPSWFCVDDRGDYGVQAMRKLSVVMGGGAFVGNTLIFNSGLTTIGAKLMMGTVTIDTLGRTGLVAQSGSNVILGYVLKTATLNGGKLQFINILT